MAIHLGRPLPDASRDRPGRQRGNAPCRPSPERVSADIPSLLGLAPGGVCRAAPVAGRAVRSYRTLSPLPAGAVPEGCAWAGGLLSVALSLGLPPPDVIRHRISVEPGLSSPRFPGERPSGHLTPGEARQSGGRAQEANAPRWFISQNRHCRKRILLRNWCDGHHTVANSRQGLFRQTQKDIQFCICYRIGLAVEARRAKMPLKSNQGRLSA